jgi:hypothetical protein
MQLLQLAHQLVEKFQQSEPPIDLVFWIFLGFFSLFFYGGSSLSVALQNHSCSFTTCLFLNFE